MTFQIAVFYVWADLKEFCYLNLIVFKVLLFFQVMLIPGRWSKYSWVCTKSPEW